MNLAPATKPLSHAASRDVLYPHQRHAALLWPVGMQTLSNAGKADATGVELKRSGGLRQAGHGISMAT